LCKNIKYFLNNKIKIVFFLKKNYLLKNKNKMSCSCKSNNVNKQVTQVKKRVSVPPTHSADGTIYSPKKQIVIHRPAR
jgi:hypothetical protein